MIIIFLSFFLKQLRTCILNEGFSIIYISLSWMLFVIDPCITCHGSKYDFSLFGVELKQTLLLCPDKC